MAGTQTGLSVSVDMLGVLISLSGGMLHTFLDSPKPYELVTTNRRRTTARRRRNEIGLGQLN